MKSNEQQWVERRRQAIALSTVCVGTAFLVMGAVPWFTGWPVWLKLSSLGVWFVFVGALIYSPYAPKKGRTP